jgi:hypothetical protein
METRSFERFAGTCAVAVGAAGIAYAVAFVTILHSATQAAAALDNALLVVAGLLGTAVFTALYFRLREADGGFALWAFVLGLGGAFGSIAHGGQELAKIANPPASDPELPNATDPRGLATFALTALAVLVVAMLILRSGVLPRGLGRLGIVSGLLLLVVYFGRLIALDPNKPWLLAAAVAAGFVANPAWFVWLGLTLRRGDAAPAPARAAAKVAG